jgi:site-specific DNA-cytosine methylase
VRILVACEESQAVTKEFRRLGHEAYSCDIIECSGGHPEWHIQGDVLEILNEGWDMMIAFPPCTHLAVSGAKHFEQKRKDGRQQEGIDFFMALANAPIERIAIENPVGIMSTKWCKPDQIIQPWQFGDSATKTTCLWLKNLPPLKPTNIVDKGERTVFKSGKSHPKWYADALKLSPADRAKVRSATFPGIAKAMAEQWSNPQVDVQIELFAPEGGR